MKQNEKNRYSVATVSWAKRIGASSERWYLDTFGLPVGPGPSKSAAFLELWI